MGTWTLRVLCFPQVLAHPTTARGILAALEDVSSDVIPVGSSYLNSRLGGYI